MGTLQDILDRLDQMDIDPSEVKISRPAYKYLLEKAEELIATEDEEEDEE